MNTDYLTEKFHSKLFAIPSLYSKLLAAPSLFHNTCQSFSRLFGIGTYTLQRITDLKAILHVQSTGLHKIYHYNSCIESREFPCRVPTCISDISADVFCSCLVNRRLGVSASVQAMKVHTHFHLQIIHENKTVIFLQWVSLQPIHKHFFSSFDGLYAPQL